MTTTQIAQISQRLACIPDALERKAIELMPIQGREILLASLQGIKVNMMTDRQLDELVASVLLTGLLKLGHKNQMEDPKEMKVFRDSICELIRERWAYLTETEVRLVFKMGVRGDFRPEPKPGMPAEIIYLNEPNINTWFKSYRFQKKTEANLQKQKLMGSLEKAPALVMTEEEATEEKISRLEVEIDRLSTPGERYRDFDIGNVLQGWLEGIGLIKLTDAQKLEILNRERAMLLAERKQESREVGKKVSYKLFAAALENGTHASGNMYEAEAKNRAKKEALKGFMLATLESSADVRTLAMEQMEFNRQERLRLMAIPTEEGLYDEATHWHKLGDRHRLELVRAEIKMRQR